MAVIVPCSNCGHEQSIGDNPVDGRIMWWSDCEACHDGDFMSPPDPRFMDALVHHFRANPQASPETDIQQALPS
jgi:hypothetical protein